MGSVDFRGIVEDESADHALLVIHWSANLHGVGSSGDVRDYGKWRRYRTLYVVTRRKEVRTHIDRAIYSAHCPSCGAPESDLASDACEFCGTVLNDGGYDWVLDEFGRVTLPTR